MVIPGKCGTTCMKWKGKYLQRLITVTSFLPTGSGVRSRLSGMADSEVAGF